MPEAAYYGGGSYFLLVSSNLAHRERQELDNEYPAILHILHTALVHRFLLLITVINPADP